MIPRAEIVSLDRYVNPSRLKEIFIKTGLSKILIHQENIDNIVGYISVQHMFNDYKNFKFADGFGAEIFTISLLRFMFSKVYSLEEKEHVTSYLWNKGIFLNPGSSLIANFSRNISIDINNKTDYKKINYYVKKFRLIPKDKTSKIIKIIFSMR